jgi:hypothetical protein
LGAVKLSDEQRIETIDTLVICRRFTGVLDEELKVYGLICIKKNVRG